MMDGDKSNDNPDMLKEILAEVADMRDIEVRLTNRIRGLEKAMQLQRKAIINFISKKLPDDS